ncbi:MAG: Calx-beta domain-containing protein [Pseudomonadota bacterium]
MPSVLTSGSTAQERQNEQVSLEFSITLTQPADETIDVPLRFASGTADRNGDFVGSDDSVRFSAGQTTRTESVTVRPDADDEADEAIVLETFGAPDADLPGGAVVSRSVSWIQDLDSAPLDLALFVGAPVLLEGDDGTRTGTFSLELSRPAPVELSIPYTVGPFATSRPDDPDLVSGEIVIPAGGTRAAIGFDVVGDAVSTANLPIDLLLDLPDAVATSSPTRAIVLDDDAVLEGAQPTAFVLGSRFGERDRDGGFLELGVALSAPAEETTDIPFRFFAGTATEGSDFNANSAFVRFVPGDTVVTTSVRYSSDDDPEFDESVVLEISTAPDAVIAGFGSTEQTVGWITDDDGEAAPIALFAQSPTILEADGASRIAVVQLELSRPALTDLTISYNTIASGATAGTDYVETSGSVSFPRGAQLATIGIEILSDEEAEFLEFVDLSFGLPGQVTQSTGGRISILDNDTARNVTVEEARAVAYLYEAGLNRDGDFDLPGLNFWIGLLGSGVSLVEIAEQFLNSDEFAAVVGDPDALSDLDLVQGLYQNVLGREGEPDGVAFWSSVVAQPDYGRDQLLLDFSQSDENRAAFPVVDQLASVSEEDWAFLG